MTRQVEVKNLELAERNAEVLSLKEKVREQDNQLKNSDNMQARNLKYANAELENKISILERDNIGYGKKLREL